MKILIVAATWNEIKPLEEFLLQQDAEKKFRQHAITLLVTGAGSMQTAFHLGKMLPIDNWDLAVNIGICGSFNRELPLGTTVNVQMDTFGDLGAADDNIFLDAFELELIARNEFPFQDGWIINSSETPVDLVKGLPNVKGITMNTVSGNQGNIEKLVSKFHPDIESMEGAAFMFCCRKESIPFLQLRTISNYVEKRNKSSWNIPLAIKNLNAVATRLLEELLDDARLEARRTKHDEQ